MQRFALVVTMVLSGSAMKVEKSYMVPVGPLSPWSPQSQVLVLEGTPPTPAGMVLEDMYNGRDVRIQWTCIESPLITSFEIERQRGDGTIWQAPETIVVSDPAAREYIDAPGQGYVRYRVRSRNNRIPLE
jgi:hypothetical protein